MINSNVSDIVTHQKVYKTPTELRVLPLIGTRFGSSFWGGVTFPVIFQIFDEDGTPIHYKDVSITEPTVTYSDFGLTLENVIQLSATNWDRSNDPCGEKALSCFRGDLTFNLSGYDILSSVDECGNVTEIEIPNTLSGDVIFGLDVLGTNITGGFFDSTLTTFDEPFDVMLEYEDTTYLEYMQRFDIIDCNGNGILFSNPESKVTDILSSVFSDDFTRKINQKVLGFDQNLKSVSTSDTLALDELGEIMGINTSGFSEGVPTEILDILKLGSIRYEDLFGVEDVSIIYNPDNVGVLISPTDTIEAGEVLFVRKTTDYSKPYDIFVTPTQSDIDFLGETGVESTTYLLSDLEHPIYDPNTHCFWRNNFDTSSSNIVNNMIDLDRLPYIPTKLQWFELIQQKLEFQLYYNLIG